MAPRRKYLQLDWKISFASKTRQNSDPQACVVDGNPLLTHKQGSSARRLVDVTGEDAVNNSQRHLNQHPETFTAVAEPNHDIPIVQELPSSAASKACQNFPRVHLPCQLSTSSSATDQSSRSFHSDDNLLPLHRLRLNEAKTIRAPLAPAGNDDEAYEGSCMLILTVLETIHASLLKMVKFVWGGLGRTRGGLGNEGWGRGQQVDEAEDAGGQVGKPDTLTWTLQDWRSLLDRRGICPLEPESSTPNILTYFPVFQEWFESSHPSHGHQWRTWESIDIDIMLSGIELMMGELEEDDPKHQICGSWRSKIVRQTGILPVSFLVYGVSRISQNPQSLGGNADVYLGERQQKPVAIKMLRILPSDEDLRKKAAHEVLSWKSLDHPHILPFLGVSYHIFPGRLSLISPWMPNENIRLYITEHPEANKTLLLHQCALALCYLHDLKLVHGDVKPTNILIDEQGNVRLADFGLTAISATVTRDATSAFKAGQGTTQYMAPELFIPEEIPGRASDVYAFGMTILETYTQRLPFPSLNAVQVMCAVIMHERPERSIHRCELSDDIWALIKDCWAQSPGARPKIADVEKRLKARLELIDIGFRCLPRCQCPWRELLDRRGIYSLDQDVLGITDIFLALQRFVIHSDQLSDWSLQERRILKSLIDSISRGLPNSSCEQRLSSTWIRQLGLLDQV